MGLPPEALRPFKAGEPLKGVAGLVKAQWDAGQMWAGKGASAVDHLLKGGGMAAVGRGVAKGALRALPVAGSLYAAAEAYRDFEKGDVVGGILSAVGVIPGPVGWVALGADFLWEEFHHAYGLWDAPDGTNTHILQGGAKDAPGVREADANLTDAQRQVFSFQDGPSGTVWNSNPPAALRLDTPEVKKAVTDWLHGIAAVFAQIDSTLQSSGEPYMLQYRAKLSTQFAAMAKLPTQTSAVMAQLKAASDAAGKQYQAVLDANKAVRQQLHHNGEISDQGPGITMKTQLTAAVSQMGVANDALSKLFGDTVPVLAATGRTAPAHQAGSTGPAAPKPAPAPPAVTPPAPSPGAGGLGRNEPKDDDLGRLLSSLGHGGPGGGVPMGSPMGGGAPLGGTPLGGAPHAAPQPVAQPVKAEEHQPVERRHGLAASTPENNRSGATPAAAAPAPAAPAVPATPGAPLGPTAKQADTTVDVKGKKVKFPDAKTAKLAQILAAADPNHPVSLADAAKQAGLTPPVPGQDPGRQVAPSDAKPGDVLNTGGKRYMLLGDGQFYDLDEYKVIGADALPKELGERAGYFHLADPAAGQTATGAVSGQTQGAPEFSVPAANPAPHPPANASVPTNGTPGVPGNGAPAPANAAATDAGVGGNVPSAAVPRLDPGAVK